MGANLAGEGGSGERGRERKERGEREREKKERGERGREKKERGERGGEEEKRGEGERRWREKGQEKEEGGGEKLNLVAIDTYLCVHTQQMQPIQHYKVNSGGSEVMMVD